MHHCTGTEGEGVIKSRRDARGKGEERRSLSHSNDERRNALTKPVLPMSACACLLVQPVPARECGRKSMRERKSGCQPENVAKWQLLLL